MGDEKLKKAIERANERVKNLPSWQQRLDYKDRKPQYPEEPVTKAGENDSSHPK